MNLFYVCMPRVLSQYEGVMARGTRRQDKRAWWIDFRVSGKTYNKTNTMIRGALKHAWHAWATEHGLAGGRAATDFSRKRLRDMTSSTRMKGVSWAQLCLHKKKIVHSQNRLPV